MDNPTDTDDRPDPNPINIAVPVVLVGIILILLVALALSALLFLKKRRKLCFKERYDDVKPFLRTDEQLESRASKAGWFYQYKKQKKSAGKTNKKKNSKVRYHSIGKTPRFPKSDPFANKFLENPMVNEDDFDEDWTNPAFDSAHAQVRDAAVTIQCWYRMIRVRVPYLQLRESTILCQALYKGYRVRKVLPQLKREKQMKDQQRKKQVGWKKKGTLSALKFFDVKGFGFAEVEQLYGLEIVRNAAQQLKNLYGGKGKMRLKLFISVNGLKLYDYHTFNHFATVKISSVSFCTLDPKNKKIFAFINRKKKRNFCHVFQANEHDAQKMVETIAEAFEVTFKRLEEKRESREMARLAAIKKRAFHRQSQELDVEVASMMEMAETASISTTPSLDRRSNPPSIIEHQGSSDGSTTGSTERLLPSGPQRHSRTSNRSSLTVSQKAPQARQVEAEMELGELRNEDSVEVLTDFKEGMDSVANTLEKQSRVTSADIERKKLNTTLDRMVHRFA